MFLADWSFFTMSAHDTVAAMLAPALFLTATGSLIISTANRMGRIIDRIRQLTAQSDTLGRGDSPQDFIPERRRHIMRELTLLQKRSRRMMVAVTMLYMAFGSFAATSMMIAIDTFTGNKLGMLPAICAIVGVALQLGACANLLAEARSALRSSNMQLEFLREIEQLRSTRTSQPVSTTPTGRT